MESDSFGQSGCCHYGAPAAAWRKDKLHLGKAALGINKNEWLTCKATVGSTNMQYQYQPQLPKMQKAIKCICMRSPCLHVRVVVSAGESISTLGSFWRLADDEVGTNPKAYLKATAHEPTQSQVCSSHVQVCFVPLKGFCA